MSVSPSSSLSRIYEEWIPVNSQPNVNKLKYTRSTYCLSVRSKKACFSLSRLISSSLHPLRCCISAKAAFFFLFKFRLMARSKKQIKSWALSKTRMVIFPGRNSGESLGWKISVPMMLPTLKDTSVIALIVFCERRAVQQVYNGRAIKHMHLLCVTAGVTSVVGIHCGQRASECPDKIHR